MRSKALAERGMQVVYSASFKGRERERAQGDRQALKTSPAEAFSFKGISRSIDRAHLNCKAWFWEDNTDVVTSMHVRTYTHTSTRTHSWGQGSWWESVGGLNGGRDDTKPRKNWNTEVQELCFYFLTLPPKYFIVLFCFGFFCMCNK